MENFEMKTYAKQYEVNYLDYKGEERLVCTFWKEDDQEADEINHKDAVRILNAMVNHQLYATPTGREVECD